MDPHIVPGAGDRPGGLDMQQISRGRRFGAEAGKVGPADMAAQRLFERFTVHLERELGVGGLGHAGCLRSRSPASFLRYTIVNQVFVFRV